MTVPNPANDDSAERTDDIPEPADDSAERPEPTEDNPLLQQSTLPYGLPDFARLRAEHFAPALERGMAEQLVEVDRIAADPAAPDLENTVVALERSGALLGRATRAFSNLVTAVGSPELHRIEREFVPRLTAHTDAIRLNRALFDRIDAVHSARDAAGLTGEQRRLVERYHLDFVLAGARLDDEGAARLRELNQAISVAGTVFAQNLLAASEAAAVAVDDPADLDGLGPQGVGAAAAAATERGSAAPYLVPLVLPTRQPALAALTSRPVRERLFTASIGRAGAGEYDNGPVAIEIARLRARRARLLGFVTHADAVLADQTAGSSEVLDAFLAQLVTPAVANARAEAASLSELAAADGIELAPWDWTFYAERDRARRLELDTDALSRYFELHRVLTDGVFFAAGRLYGVSFQRRSDLTGYHPDVEIYEVFDADGAGIGLFLADFFAREGKRGGAWMNSFVEQATLTGEFPVVSVNLNVDRPAAGERAHLSLDEVTTLFHEFGHALHGLFSAVTFPRFSGTNVPGDFVEFPSQVNEMWAMWPEVLENYAVHSDTGEKLPAEQVTAVRASAEWGQGFATTEYLAATLLDLAWHRITPEQEITSADEFETAALAHAGVDLELIPPRYRTTYFQHIFAGQYSAGYYFYIWSEVLDADTVEWFSRAGGLRRDNGDAFRRKLLSVGGSGDPVAAFSAVVGGPPDIAPLLRRRGLDRPAQGPAA